MPLKDLQARHPDSRLLVFTGSGDLVSPLTGQPQEWLEPLSRWQERVILAPDKIEATLLDELQSRDFVVLPMTLDGLASLVRAFETDNIPLSTDGERLPVQLRERPMRWTGRDTPSQGEIVLLVNDIRDYLGVDGFQWLCATAVYPELRWELTLYLGSALQNKNGQPLLNPENLLQLTHLPWFRLGYMPDWFRLALIGGMSETEDSGVRDILGTLLESAFQTKDNPLDLLIAAKQSVSLSERSMKMLRFLFSGRSTESALHDYIFLRFLLKKDQKRLAVLFNRLSSRLGSLFELLGRLRANFSIWIQTRELSRKSKLYWLEPGEVIYYTARMHLIALVQKLALPVLSLMVPISLFYYFFSFSSLTLILTSAWVLLIAILLWITWRVLNWLGNYFIVTNQRVVRTQGVFGIFDTKEESLFRTILSVGVEADRLGRLLRFGNVVIRTYVGVIRFANIANPNDVAGMIEEHWRRAKEETRVLEKELVKDAIREKLGLSKRKTSILSRLLEPDSLKTRFEVDGIITYRKHWIVLFSQLKPQIIILLIVLAALIFQPIVLGGYTAWSSALGVMLLIADVYWARNGFSKWTDDTYQITPYQVISAKRTSSGEETREHALIEDIRASEYTRRSFLGNLLNFGTIKLTLASKEFYVEDVLDPPSVQREIDHRRMQILQVNREEQLEVERTGITNTILDGINSNVRAEIAPEATRLLRVFLCHSSSDKPIVRDLYRRLDDEDWIDVWLDSERIYPGQEWDFEIKKAVEKADIILVCLTKNSVDNGGYAQRELRMVLDAVDYKREDTLFVIPVRLEECDILESLRKQQHVDLFEKGGYRRLISVLRARASTIGVTLPRTEKEFAGLDFTKTKDSDRILETQRERKRLLLADPSREYRRSIIGFLELEGYAVEEVSSPEEALGKLEGTQFDLALVDIRLSDISDSNDTSGLEVAKRASESGIPCIIVTAFPTVELARLALRARGSAPFATDMVTKASGPQALLDSIRLTLRRRQESPTDARIRRISIDTDKKLVWNNGKLVNLARNQYTLLEELYKRDGGVCTYQELIRVVYGEESSSAVATNDTRLRNLVERLKLKIEDKNSDQKIIEAVIGKGYRLRNSLGLADLENEVKENQSFEDAEITTREKVTRESADEATFESEQQPVSQTYKDLGLANLGTALKQDPLETDIAVWGPTQSGKDWLFRGFAREIEHYNARYDDFLFDLYEETENGIRQVIVVPPHDIAPTSSRKDFVYNFRRKPINQDEAHLISSHVHKIYFHNIAGTNLISATVNQSTYERALAPILRSKYLMVVLDASINQSARSIDSNENEEQLERNRLELTGRPDLGREAYLRILTMLMQLLSDSSLSDRQVAICMTKIDTTGDSSDNPWYQLERIFGKKIHRLINRHRKRFNIEVFATSATGFYRGPDGKINPNFSGGQLVDVDNWNPINCAAPFFWLFENQERDQMRKNSNLLNRDTNLRKYIPYPTRRNI